MLSSKKEAFKLGFVTKLAENGISLVEALEKCGAYGPLLGAGLTAGVTIPAAAVSMAGLGLTAATKLPHEVGGGLGTMGAYLSEVDEPSGKQLRKQYLIRRYEKLLERMRANRELRNVSRAKRDVMTGAYDEEEGENV